MSDRSVYDFLNHGLREMPQYIGMDYESAVEAMPHWYGVSFGNGNDGVSHFYPNFYVRTCEPYTLAAAAMLSDFKPSEGQAWCAENLEIDGEADYTISATLFDPPDDRKDYESDLAEAQTAIDGAETDEELEKAEADLQELEDSDSGYWSESNGAWMICEVFRVDEPDERRSAYDSLREAFSDNLIALAREV